MRYPNKWSVVLIMDEKINKHGGEPSSQTADGSQTEVMDMETLLAQEGLGLGEIPQQGDIRTGVITAITPHEILIDIQSKADGVIGGRELEAIEDETLEGLQEGEEILVYVVEPEDPNGNVLLSYSRAQEEKDWERVDKLLESGEPIETEIEGYNKGGLLVPVGRLRGFVPGSLVSVFREGDGTTPEERWEECIGEEITLKVIEVDRDRKRLILSEKDAIGETREAIKDQLIGELEEGKVVSGYVSSLADFGAFVNIQGVDGLVHLSELSWEHVDHPRDVVKVGQEVKVMVISIDEERKRIGLSLRRLEDNPWLEKAEELQEGQLVTGTITNLTDFGAFARIEDTELEGLIHISELSDQRINHPSEVVSVGESMALRVISIDLDRHRIGLSLDKVDSADYASLDFQQLQEEMAEDEGLEEEAGSADTETEAALEDTATEEDQEVEVGPEDLPEEEAEAPEDLPEENEETDDPVEGESTEPAE